MRCQMTYDEALRAAMRRVRIVTAIGDCLDLLRPITGRLSRGTATAADCFRSVRLQKRIAKLSEELRP